MLRAAIVYTGEEDEIFVAIEPEKFVELLEAYYKQHGSIQKAMEAIEFDLKQKTMYK